MSSALIDTVRNLVTDGGMSRSGLARAAGLHANSLRKLGESDWNPTADTLGKLESYLLKREGGTALASPEEIINEARNGRMFILVDDEDRENEGDLVIPAQMATPDAINFMATHGRGLICLALTKSRTEELGLDLMSRNNGTRHETAFTVSIEAREGVTTGISAADRARTVSVAIDGSKGKVDIVTPGHVFPLIAKDGGVLVRTGHTEAAVDVARLAGLNPSGVICEVMKDDGTMARLDDLIPFAQKHKMKIGTIRDLIAYRRRHDHMIERRAETTFDSRWGGDWKAISFYNKATQTEQLVLQKGHVDPDKPTLVRMHQMSPLSDTFGKLGARTGLLPRCMEIIGDEGAGIIVILRGDEPDMLTRMLQYNAGIVPGDMDELRNYGAGAQILADLGVHDMILLTNSHHSLIALDGYDLAVVGQRPIEL
ncbi:MULTISPECIES: 3,4-dihydroxy-2-butanone-4-phosphate synthase [Sphingobium]|uniref:3,4-dihydroxy-2-butanone 4-phosphate synthase n=1 Tax=Sphingobium cupriresistens TaxID=1132417 RepID=A0A8G1ZJ71_9SPHN|nr:MULTISPECIES: 3,4-dihydroxy-2-butanone-4-phosphate synthase [Sphingobium]MBJ7378166.1 3,4-dihydroxy-2-butanone-4-phosphate synthase [Sphingobium sp.]RYM14593.1 3,4-dihydroxy-2-butanone-4-phosphate synthase [Sphingobium cupriresistens]WCP13441.1 Riboflavin biosynthesis protein RibBA [Sphingobium sp. AntQ-1]